MLSDKSKKQNDSKSENKPSEKDKFVKKYIALKTMKITCNGEFNLIEGKEIPKGIDEAFIKSLINSNLIKK